MLKTHIELVWKLFAGWLSPLRRTADKIKHPVNLETVQFE